MGRSGVRRYWGDFVVAVWNQGELRNFYGTHGLTGQPALRKNPPTFSPVGAPWRVISRLSGGDYQETAPVVSVSNLGCWQWKGDVTVAYDYEDGTRVSSTTTVTLANASHLAAAPVHVEGGYAVQSAATTATVTGTTSSVRTAPPSPVSTPRPTARPVFGGI